MNNEIVKEVLKELNEIKLGQVKIEALDILFSVRRKLMDGIAEE